MNTILTHPTYFPSIRQMAAIVQADMVIFEVEDNYQKQTYRNRAHIAHSNGLLHLHVPILHTKDGTRQKTKQVRVENSFPWQSQHWKSLQVAYRSSPFFEFYEDDLKSLFQKPVEQLLDHNFDIFYLLCELLGIHPKQRKTTHYEARPKIQDLRWLVNAKKEIPFDQVPYTQVLESLHGFLPNLSVLDLLFNEGPNALPYLESLSWDCPTNSSLM